MMAGAENNIAVFVGTTTASNQVASAAFTWDLASSPAESTPTATRSEIHSSRGNGVNVPTSTPSIASSTSTSSTALSRAIDSPQHFPQAYDRSTSEKPSSAVYISLIVLSVVVFVTALVLGWLAWRRYRQHSRKRTAECLDGKHQVCINSPRKPASMQSGIDGRASPEQVFNKDSRVSVPRYSIDQFLLLGNSKVDPALANVRLGHDVSVKGPAPIEKPPTPPAKQASRISPAVLSPPARPTKAIRPPRGSSRDQGTASHVQFRHRCRWNYRAFHPSHRFLGDGADDTVTLHYFLRWVACATGYREEGFASCGERLSRIIRD